MTSTEFVKWVRFLEWRDVEEFRREDYYLAQIAAQIERGHVKNPSQVTIQRKLLKFTSQEPPKDAGKQVQKSKAFWMTLARARKGAESQQDDPPSPASPDTQPQERDHQERGKRKRRAR